LLNLEFVESMIFILNLNFFKNLLLSKFSKELSLNNLNKSETKKNYKFKEIKKKCQRPFQEK